MLTLNGRSTCSLCRGLDDRAAVKVAGFSSSDFTRPRAGGRHLVDDLDDPADLDQAAA
jgi:hypothetical protein